MTAYQPDRDDADDDAPTPEDLERHEERRALLEAVRARVLRGLDSLIAAKAVEPLIFIIDCNDPGTAESARFLFSDQDVSQTINNPDTGGILVTAFDYHSYPGPQLPLVSQWLTNRKGHDHPVLILANGEFGIFGQETAEFKPGELN